MDPPAKKMKTSPPTLCDMPDEILAHIASHLEPGDVFNMVLSSKKLFRPAGVVDLTADEDANQDEALGFKLVKWSMRHRLKEVLTRFTFDDLFPEEERNLDFVSGQPQVSFSLLSHQPPAQLLRRHTHKKYRFADAHRRLRGSQVRGSEWIRKEWCPGDIDIFCTWDAAPMVRRRLFQRCGLICGGVVRNTSYTDEGPYLVGDVENRATAVISHVEEYARRPMNEDEYEWEFEDSDDSGDEGIVTFKPEAYYKKAKQWGAEVLAPRSNMDPAIGKPGGSLGGDFLFDYHFQHEGFLQLIIGRPHVKDATKLLRHFDIEICKCAFSASKVYIPAAVETLAGRTFINPARHALADGFMKALNQVKPQFPLSHTCSYQL